MSENIIDCKISFDDDLSNDYKLLDNMNEVQFQKDYFAQRLCIEYAKIACSKAAPGYYGLYKTADNILSGGCKIEGNVLLNSEIKDGVTHVSSVADKSISMILEYQSYDEELQKFYDQFYSSRTGWQAGFVIKNAYIDTRISSVLNSNPKCFITIDEPYSPQGFYLQEEIYNGFYTSDLNEIDKKKLLDKIENTNFYYDGCDIASEELKDDVRKLLFGEFDREIYLEENGNDEIKLTKVYTEADSIYSKTFDESLVKKGLLRKDEILKEQCGSED